MKKNHNVWFSKKIVAVALLLFLSTQLMWMSSAFPLIDGGNTPPANTELRLTCPEGTGSKVENGQIISEIVTYEDTKPDGYHQWLKFYMHGTPNIACGWLAIGDELLDNSPDLTWFGIVGGESASDFLFFIPTDAIPYIGAEIAIVIIDGSYNIHYFGHLDSAIEVEHFIDAHMLYD